MKKKNKKIIIIILVIVLIIAITLFLLFGFKKFNSTVDNDNLEEVLELYPQYAFTIDGINYKYSQVE